MSRGNRFSSIGKFRRIPEHPRIVKLIGSVIDYSDRDQAPVLLVMERLRRDLHAALKNRLDFPTRYSIIDRSIELNDANVHFVSPCRMRIALDVVEGLRYLHGLGLVHRDIKLKNVLVSVHPFHSLHPMRPFVLVCSWTMPIVLESLILDSVSRK